MPRGRIKLRAWSRRVRCTIALSKDANSVKALFRRGKALMELNEFAASKADLVAASKLDPKSREVQSFILKFRNEV